MLLKQASAPGYLFLRARDEATVTAGGISGKNDAAPSFLL
jgi:hypothetical protein